MVDKKIIYRTHFRRRPRLLALYRATIAFSLSFVFIYLFFRYGSYFYLIVGLLTSFVGLFVLTTFFPRYPFHITETHFHFGLVGKLPAEIFYGVGQHPIKDCPCLLYIDPKTGEKGHFVLPWTFIREPHDQVIVDLVTYFANQKRDK